MAARSNRQQDAERQVDQEDAVEAVCSRARQNQGRTGRDGGAQHHYPEEPLLYWQRGAKRAVPTGESEEQEARKPDQQWQGEGDAPHRALAYQDAAARCWAASA